ncbi:MAG: DNA mismatch repair endonuclease MutL [Planctomycetota bacterium]
MQRIRQLSAHLVNQIAAGEVIERPASVVKELVENSIDAGAVEILVELEEGGKRSIRVIDDGFGIVPEDLTLAVASHATSKLGTEEDLHRVRTLGFRGEALASMASVGELDIVSRPPGQATGERVFARDGHVERGPPEMIAAGTRVTLRNLFYNVPARKRFLRNDRAELTRVSAVLQHIALAVPEVGFTLVHGGRVVFRFAKGQDQRERIQEVLGEETMGRMLELDPQHPQLRGWIGRADLWRRNAQDVYTFLNGRFLRDRTLVQAVREGFRGFQIPGRNPVAVVFLQLPVDEFDVNVHPAKLEVRFRDSGAVFSLVRGAVLACLERASSVPDLIDPRAPLRQTESAHRAFPRDAALTPSPFPSVRGWAEPPPGVHERVAEPGSERRATPTPIGDASRWRNAPENALPDLGHERSTAPRSAGERSGELPIDPPSAAEAPVFQVHNAYLVLEEPGGLTVIDQHALHEKILFEELCQAHERGTLRQPLLIPEAVHLAPEAWIQFGEQQSVLASLGLVAEEFGQRTVLIRSVPMGFEQRDSAGLLQELLQRLANTPQGANELELRLRGLETLACKRAVKAGQRLNPEQQRDLIRGRAKAFQPRNCPHGRAAELFLSWDELERRFDRR